MRDRRSDAYRLQTSRRLGRTLSPDEVVDHINEDKTDASPSNLRVIGRSAHTTHHNRTRQLGRLRRALAMPKTGEKLY